MVADTSGPFFAVGREGGVRLPLPGTVPITGVTGTPDRDPLALILHGRSFLLHPG